MENLNDLKIQELSASEKYNYCGGYNGQVGVEMAGAFYRTVDSITGFIDGFMR